MRDGSRAIKDYLLLAARILLAGVFIYAALQKVDKPLLFADEIRMYGVIDRGPLLYFMAIVLPWMEIFCGVSLLTGLLMRGSALILFLFNVMYIGVITYRTLGIMNAEGTAFTSVYFDCGCGFGATYAWKKLLEDAGLLLLALWIFLSARYRFVIPAGKLRP